MKHVLSIGLTLALGACGSTSSPESRTPPAAAAPTTPKAQPTGTAPTNQETPRRVLGKDFVKVDVYQFSSGGKESLYSVEFERTGPQRFVSFSSVFIQPSAPQVMSIAFILPDSMAEKVSQHRLEVSWAPTAGGQEEHPIKIKNFVAIPSEVGSPIDSFTIQDPAEALASEPESFSKYIRIKAFDKSTNELLATFDLAVMR